MEKTLFNQVGEVKGKTSEKEDSFSFQFTPQNENLKRTRGALFTLVTVETDEKEKFEKAKSFYHTFQSSYYAKVSGSIINSLSDTIDQVNTDIVKKEAQTGTNISMVAAVFWGSVLYLARIGSSGVFVARAGKLKKLEFNKVASGVLEDRDAVCLASAKFLEKVTEENLGEFLGEEKFEKALEKIDKEIQEVEGATCTVIRLSVNVPESLPQELAVAEVDQAGKVEFSEKEVAHETSGENGATSEGEPEFIPEAQGAKEGVLQAFLTKAGEFFEIGKSLAARLTGKVFNRLSKPWRGSEPGEHVDHVAVRKQRIVQVVAVILILLVVSIAFGIYSKTQGDKKEKINQLITSVEASLDQARNLKNIDPVSAKSLVEKAQDSLEEAERLKAPEDKISNLKSESAELIAEITRSYQVESLDTVFDFTTISSSAKINRLALGSELLLATDKDSAAVYKINLESKDGGQVDGSFSGPENITAYPGGFYLQTEKGVTKLNVSGEKPATAASNSNWGTIVAAASYQSNLYLLDREKAEIWRYFGTSSGLSGARAYIVGEKPDLSQASAMGIDDLVWVATRKGSIYKFAQGKKQEFELSNLSDSFGDVVDLYTSTETKNHYILDQGKGRVVIVSKDGVYQAQYSHQQLHQATSVVVNEDEKTVYFAANGKLYSFKFS